MNAKVPGSVLALPGLRVINSMVGFHRIEIAPEQTHCWRKVEIE